jgi:sugar phosphate isomerase/epimerase
MSSVGHGLNVQWSKSLRNLANIKALAKQGFDSAELTVPMVMEMNEQQFRDQRQELLQSGIALTVFASPLPAGVRVTEKGFNIYVWSEYLKKALDRVAELGGNTVVWSDGRSRILPLEGEVAAAKRQALQFLFMLSELADTHSIRILTEPLDPRRTNFLTSMDEVAEFLRLVGSPNLSSVISLRDLDATGFDRNAFERHASLISHVYMENPSSPPGTRIEPRPDDNYDYRSFLAQLSGIGYSGTITLPEAADAEALQFCRSLIGE